MSGEADIVLTLPLPPSANRIWRHANGRNFRAPEYDQWLTAAGWSIQQQRAGDSVPYRFSVRITMPPTRTDLDNCCKPLLDLLQRQAVVQNDKYAREITLRRDDARDPATVLVEVWALPEPEPVKKARKRVLRLTP